MTRKEAKRRLLDTVDCGGCGYTDECNDCIVTATLMAIESLEKAEKYKWHDLRKDPFDLPSKHDLYMIAYKSKYTNKIYTNLEVYFEQEKEWGTPMDYEVIAWRDFEPFEEVSE